MKWLTPSIVVTVQHSILVLLTPSLVISTQLNKSLHYRHLPEFPRNTAIVSTLWVSWTILCTVYSLDWHTDSVTLYTLILCVFVCVTRPPRLLYKLSYMYGHCCFEIFDIRIVLYAENGSFSTDFYVKWQITA